MSALTAADLLLITHGKRAVKCVLQVYLVNTDPKYCIIWLFSMLQFYLLQYIVIG